MISLLLVALVGVALSKNVVLFAGALKSENDPVNMKLTKLLDVKIESKSDYWKNDLSRLLQSQAEENSLGKNEEYVQVPLKLSFGIERTNNKDSGEEGMESIFQTCGSLVGRNQLPFCRFNPHKVQKLNSNSYPRSCREILESGKNQSGIYVIKPRTSSKPYSVLCDMESRGGGWTYIQNRFDGSQDFYLPWRDYKFGFGDLDGEFWMGLENIYHMTEGGWWYTSGHASNLNGKHMNKPLSDAYKFHGLNWNGFRGHDYNLAGSKIMIRPVAE
ncbi:angiopoietin-4-like isoform X2 [Diabrotica virgifera virgifera]|uniref:Angiopoietin-4-like isoform X2 n=1 Tax=Diabrotica virgifera virgifera TaxID=50390 RepID=A0A6P7F1Q6_DIAVI|nr:angiopoietin-4-like isoform X2 [Diabrotica virgifera virgifera]